MNTVTENDDVTILWNVISIHTDEIIVERKTCESYWKLSKYKELEIEINRKYLIENRVTLVITSLRKEYESLQVVSLETST